MTPAPSVQSEESRAWLEGCLRVRQWERSSYRLAVISAHWTLPPYGGDVVFSRESRGRFRPELLFKVHRVYEPKRAPYDEIVLPRMGVYVEMVCCESREVMLFTDVLHIAALGFCTVKRTELQGQPAQIVKSWLPPYTVNDLLYMARWKRREPPKQAVGFLNHLQDARDFTLEEAQAMEVAIHLEGAAFQ